MNGEEQKPEESEGSWLDRKVDRRDFLKYAPEAALVGGAVAAVVVEEAKVGLLRKGLLAFSNVLGLGAHRKDPISVTPPQKLQSERVIPADPAIADENNKIKAEIQESIDSQNKAVIDKIEEDRKNLLNQGSK